MVKKPSLASQRLKTAERGRQYRWACAGSTGPAADARRANLREQNRQRQARHRERVRQNRNRTPLTTEEDDCEMQDGSALSRQTV